MKKKIINIILIFILLIGLIVESSYASSAKISMSGKTSSSNKYVITVKLSDIDMGEKGINAMSAIVDIPSGIFEDVTSSNFKGINNWTASYTADTKKLTLIKTNFVNSDEEIFTIELKPKAELLGTIKLTDVNISNDDEQLKIDDVFLDLEENNSIENKTNSNTVSNNVNNTTNKIANAPIIISNNIVKIDNTVKNNTTTQNIAVKNSSLNNSENANNINNTFINNTATNSTVPYTGVRENVRIVLIVLMIICGYIYYKIQKMNKIC